MRSRLLAKLPDYMVPRRFVVLDALPRTATGKIDRNALPHAPVLPREMEGVYVAPRDVLEADVAAIWEDVLGIETVGIDDDFLALGGDSMGAAQIVNRVMRDFGLALPLASLFARSTVATMAELIATERNATVAERGDSPEVRTRGR